MAIEKTDIKKVVQYCIKKVFRTNTDENGFIHFDPGKNLTPFQFRTIMVDLKKELSKFTIDEFDKKLTYHWLVRFDQQVDTPFHVDNAAAQSFLMLGYEPSEIESELHIADYYRFASESNKAQHNYLKNFIPIFKGDESLLDPYIKKVNPFYNNTYTIVLINNSSPKSKQETLGVFHKAVIVNQDFSKSRIVNSMVLNMISKDRPDEDELKEEKFLNATLINK